jgi:hypothetical protein
MAQVSSAECREGFDKATGTEEISSLVLEYDLQRAIHNKLGRQR